jgi:hypothetical protein
MTPGSVWCAGLAGRRANRYEARHEWPGSAGQEALSGDPHAGDLYVFRGARGERQAPGTAATLLTQGWCC